MYRRGYSEGPFGQVHYHDTGEGGIPLVLCHQSPQSARQFDNLLPELATRGFRAIAIDTPGFGMSDVPDFVPRIEDYAKAVPAVLDHLCITQAHLAGHHTGAQIITEVALQFPDRVLSLVLNGPNPIDHAERARGLAWVDDTETNLIYAADGSHLAKSFAVRWDLYGPDADPKLTTRVVAEKFIGYGPFWYGHHAAYVYDHAASLSKIAHPALILTNTGDLIYAAAKLARRLRPDFAYVEFEGGTIDIVDQRAGDWADTVREFIQRIPLPLAAAIR